VNHDTPLCPDCNGKLTVSGSKRRIVKDAGGNEYTFSIRRLYCAFCNRHHMEIPDCIEPYKRYFRLTREAVKSGNIDFCAADDSTIYRWKHE